MIKHFCIFWLCLSVMLMVGSVVAAEMPFIEVDPASMTAFREKGTGRPFVAVGINYFDHETGWAPHLWQKFDEARVARQLRLIGEQGFNTIRVFTTLASFEQEPGKVTEQGQAKFLKLLAMCRNNGIRVIPTGPAHWEGGPAWHKGDRYADENLLAAEENWWKQFAGALADEPTILAWDLFNEPTVAWDTPAMHTKWNRWLEDKYGSPATLATAWKIPANKTEPFGKIPVPAKTPARGDAKLLDYQRFREHIGDAWTGRMASAIRSVDKNHMITVGHIQWATPILLPAVWAYAGFNLRDNARHVDFTTIHFYPLDWPKPCDHDDGIAVNGVYLQALLREACVGKPLMIGEFGWYGGGELKGQLPDRPVQHQLDWCNRLMDVSSGRVCGWLNWAFADTETSSDVTRWSGCWTSDMQLKPWGKAFGEFARSVTAKPLALREFDPPFQQVKLDRNAAITDPAAGHEYRQRLRQAVTSRPH